MSARRREPVPGGYGTARPLRFGKAAEVLAVLLETPGEYVSYDKIIHRVWPEYPDDPNTRHLMRQTVHLLKGFILDAAPEAEHAVRTVYGLGYSLVADAKTQAAIAEAVSLSFLLLQSP